MQTASVRPHLRAVILLVAAAISLSAVTAGAQKIDQAARKRNHARLGELLTAQGPGLDMAFQQSKKQPYNYSAYLAEGLINAETIEVVFSTAEKHRGAR